MNPIRTIWRAAAPYGLRQAAQPAARWLIDQRVAGRPRFPIDSIEQGPLVVSGFLKESKGISRAARLTIAGLERAGLAPVAHDIRDILNAGLMGNAAYPSAEPGGVWICHANAPEAAAAISSADPAMLGGRYRIGYWAWELPVAPERWVRISQLFNEIWVPSPFVAASLRNAGCVTLVHVMPHPVAAEGLCPVGQRTDFGIGEDDFCVLAMGDLNSSEARKNLRGAIRIYAQAFPDVSSGQKLIIKVHSARDPGQFEAALKSLLGGRSDIRIIHADLPFERVLGLIGCCDVLLSPHRAEGFGLVLAEALALGVPALATGWSGSMEFMADMPELCIDFTLEPVVDPDGVYDAPDLRWAEPVESDAVQKLRNLRQSAELRSDLVKRGRDAIDRLSLPWSGYALREMPFHGLLKD